MTSMQSVVLPNEVSETFCDTSPYEETKGPPTIPSETKEVTTQKEESKESDNDDEEEDDTMELECLSELSRADKLQLQRGNST